MSDDRNKEHLRYAPQGKAQPESVKKLLENLLHDDGYERGDAVATLAKALEAAFQRGQQATGTKVLYLCKTMNVSNIWANRNKIMEICEQAQGEAEK